MHATSTAWCRGLAALIRGGADFAEHPRRAVDALEEAERVLDAAHMRLFAASARHRRGELVGGDEGRALVDAATAAFRAEGVRAPDRMIDVFAPVTR